MSLRVQSTVAVKRISADAGGCRCGPDVEADRSAPFPPALDVNNDHRPPIWRLHPGRLNWNMKFVWSLKKTHEKRSNVNSNSLRFIRTKVWTNLDLVLKSRRERESTQDLLSLFFPTKHSLLNYTTICCQPWGRDLLIIQRLGHNLSCHLMIFFLLGWQMLRKAPVLGISLPTRLGERCRKRWSRFTPLAGKIQHCEFWPRSIFYFHCVSS